MEPLFPQNSIVLATSLPYLLFSPRKGDVIIFYDKKTKKALLKRIREVKNGQFFVGGDNKKDSLYVGWIERKDIIGKVIYGY